MAHALERAREAEGSAERNRYGYDQRTIIEELDDQGQMLERKEKLYRVRLNDGWTQMTLVRINGEDLSPEQLKKEGEREVRWRQRLTMATSTKGSDRRENFLLPELAAKFAYDLTGAELINGRLAYRVDFHPKDPAAPVRAMTDRLVNRLIGRVWIDAQEFEIARIEIHMQGEVNLWAGLLASLKKMAFTLDRVRVADGIWFNRAALGTFDGRKLLQSMHYRVHVKATDFRRIAGDEPQG